MAENEVKTRLLEFIEEIGLSVSQFEKKIGASNGYVNNMRQSIGMKIRNKIIDTFPLLNISWLLFGDGEMLKDVVGGAPGESVVMVPSNIKEKYFGKTPLVSASIYIESLERTVKLLEEQVKVNNQTIEFQQNLIKRCEAEKEGNLKGRKAG